MRKLLAFVFCLLALAGTAHAQAPTQAAAVGYNQLTYGPSLVVGTDPTVTPLQSGTNWQPFNFFGTAWQPYGVTTNANGSINIPTNTINGFGAQISTAAFTSSPSPYIKGTAFGGGFYAEVTMSFAINPTTGGPAFWANDIEAMAGGSAGDLSLRHWPGQASNYGDWIENDIAEFDSGVPANQYGISLHNFFGPPGWFSGETFVSGNQVSTSGNFYTETVASCATGSSGGPTGTGSGIVDGTCRWNFVMVAPSNGEISTIGSGSKITFPTGTDLTQPHKYGVLWVPATGAAQGFVRYYFDNVAVGNACTWNQYNSALAPPPVDSSNPCGGSSAYSIMDTRHMALILGNATASGGTPGAVTVYSVNVWQNSAAQDIGPTNPPPATACNGTAGCALPAGYLSVSGNQFIDSSGSKDRIAAVSYRGTPTDQATMNAIRQAGFNAIRIDWRDAYLSAGGGGTPTFDDEFASAPWLTHATWQSGDQFSFAGVNFPGGTSQGPTWWSNPVDTPSAAPVYSDSGGHLNLGLIQNPGGNGISNTTLGALINNQETPGGLVQLFGDYQFSIAVPNTPGFLFQWDIECFPATCSDGNMEIDVGIWTNADGSEHVQLMSQANNLNNVVWYSGTPVDITKQNVYEVNWQSNFITFYINGTQMAQVATPSGEFQTAGALSYFLTSDATYFGYGPAFTAASATAQLDYYRIYQTKPSGSAPVGCNTLAQMDQCVALAAAATPQPLKVIFSHRGNEIPSSSSNACNARQANGLWFDSGGSSGNDDGCGDGGNVTYATFKANTASLMQRYAGNSTVIGYDFHAEPLVNGAFTGTGGGGATGQFSVNSSGQIIDPNGNVWIARGFSVTLGDAQGGTTGPVSLANIQRVYPRTNYIRIWGDYPSWTPSALNSWISSLTNAGIAVAIEDYTGNGPCRTGGDLAAANAWYQAAASFYKSNPGVIFESQNECFDSSGGGPSQTQIQTNYNAVRAGGYTGLFFIGSAGGSPDPGNGEWYFSNTLFAPMTNIGFDIHPYPDAYNSAGVAATQSAFNAQLRSWIQSYSQWHTNTEPSVPVIAGEIGNCGNTPQCNGNNNSNNVPIVNWQLAVHAVAQVAAVSGNNSTGVSAGVGYWQWGDDGDASNVDTLTIGGNATNPYGVQVQGDIAGMAGTGPTPFTGGGGGGTGANPPVNWGGGGDTDILAACNDVGAAVFAVNPGVIQFCEGPLNNGANNLLSGAAKP